jgi:MGT family glycosyltransferase
MDVSVIIRITSLPPYLPTALAFAKEIALSNILICAFPNPGHVTPMLSVGLHLAGLGHVVTFHTGEIFRRQVETAGLHFAEMTGRANIDYRSPRNRAERETLTERNRILDNLQYWFIDPLPDQHRRLQQILEEIPVDLILTSSMYLGCFPMLLGPGENRPPVIGCGVTPLILRSIDCGLTSHDATPEGRKRNQEEHFLLEKAFQPIADQLNLALTECSAPSISGFWADSIYTVPDLFLQFTGEVFEFPRSDMPSKVQFVGPVLPSKSTGFKEPAWFGELDGSKPVVLVTQGTLANFDLQELVQPTITALADDDALVIAAIGRADTEDLIAPNNAKIEAFIPFVQLLPKVDVLITNGGYGAVQQALSFGVPLVVAGDTEEKAFTAARVGWTGAGINLQSRCPTPEQIRTAVHTVLADAEYRKQAQRLQNNFSRYDALVEIERSINTLIADNRRRLGQTAKREDSRWRSQKNQHILPSARGTRGR